MQSAACVHRTAGNVELPEDTTQTAQIEEHVQRARTTQNAELSDDMTQTEQREETRQQHLHTACTAEL